MRRASDLGKQVAARWPESPVETAWGRWGLPLARPLAGVLALMAPFVHDDAAVTLSLGLVFVGLCCWRP